MHSGQVASVSVVDARGSTQERFTADLEFDYRASWFKKHKDEIITSAKFQLKKTIPPLVSPE
jgi:UDP-N-acetylenolpyruvoylglucosamine reductase